MIRDTHTHYPGYLFRKLADFQEHTTVDGYVYWKPTTSAMRDESNARSILRPGKLRSKIFWLRVKQHRMDWTHRKLLCPSDGVIANRFPRRPKSICT